MFCEFPYPTKLTISKNWYWSWCIILTFHYVQQVKIQISMLSSHTRMKEFSWEHFDSTVIHPSVYMCPNDIDQATSFLILLLWHTHVTHMYVSIVSCMRSLFTNLGQSRSDFNTSVQHHRFITYICIQNYFIQWFSFVESLD